MEGVFQTISPMDILQGSRAVVALRKFINVVIVSDLPDIQNLALESGEEITEDNNYHKTSFLRRLMDWRR
jgi:hypothetical protein